MQNDTHPRPLMFTGDRRTVFAIELAHDMRSAGWVAREHVTSTRTVFLGYYEMGSDDEPPYVYDPVCGDCGCLRERHGGSLSCYRASNSTWPLTRPPRGLRPYNGKSGRLSASKSSTLKP